MDLHQPHESLGNHCFDLRTMRCPDGSIQLSICNYQGASTDYQGWNYTALGVIDPAKEEVVGTPHYDADNHVIREGKNPSVGKKLPGIYELCKKLTEAHGLIQAEHPHHGTIGWDAMLTDSGEYVIFEGNLGYQRMESFFCTTDQIIDYIYNFSWPFDRKRQFCPSNQESPYEFFWVSAPENHVCYGGGNQNLKAHQD